MSRDRVFGALLGAVVLAVAAGLALGTALVVVVALALAGAGTVAYLSGRPGPATSDRAPAAGLRYHPMMVRRGHWGVWDAESRQHLPDELPSQAAAEQAAAALNRRERGR